jgi:DNA-binding response OmpR family regulator
MTAMTKRLEIDTGVTTIAASSVSPIGVMVPAEVDNVSASSSVKTILFADDDGQLQKMVAALLHGYGYKVVVARDGNEALKKAHEFDGIIDLLLSDVDMPGMTGIELAIQLNHERPVTKILLISGLATGMLVLNNSWSFLPKPFMPEMLKDRIRDFLSEQPAIKEYLPDP